MYPTPPIHQPPQRYGPTGANQMYGDQQAVQRTSDQAMCAQYGPFVNDQGDAQQWNMYMHGAQQVNRQQPPGQQQYCTLNQGMQQGMPAMLGQQGTYPQQIPPFAQFVLSNNGLPSSITANQPFVTSTPRPNSIGDNQMAQAAKRQIDEVSRSGDTSLVQQQMAQHIPQRHDTRSNDTPKKLKASTTNGHMQNSASHSPKSTRQNPPSNGIPSQKNGQRVEISAAACRFASTRYPFSPFTISFKTTVKDKTVIDELVEIAKKEDTSLRIVAYRHKQVAGDYCILVFVENIESFCFLTNDASWPAHLCRETFTVKKPSTPPQLCAVLPNVALNIDWEEFIQDTKEQYPTVSEVIRLKNRYQQSVRAVKIVFACAKARNIVLQQKEMSIDHMKYRVVEYFTPAQVLICGNCCEIGHFQKNCPHRDKTTCKVCGVSYDDIKTHECSRVPKCIRCGEDHKSTDSKCSIVKSYRAALTRNLLQQPVTPAMGFDNANPSKADFPLAFAKQRPPFTTTQSDLHAMEVKVDNLLSKKLDLFLDEIKNETKKTRETIEDLREEVRKQNEESKTKIETIDRKVQTLEVELQGSIAIINQVIASICSALADSRTSTVEQKQHFTRETLRFKTLVAGAKSIE